MHDRETRLKVWRERLQMQDALSARDIVELEAHLLDQLRELEAKGLSQEESWMIAERRLGDAETLAEEYQRSDPSRVARLRIVWALVGILVFNVFSSLISMAQTIVGGVYLSYFDRTIHDGFELVGVGPFVVHGVIMAGAVFAVAYAAYRVWFHGRWEDWSQRLSSFAGRPGVLLSVVLGVMVLAFLVRTGSSIVTARLFAPEAFGALAVTSAYSGALFSLALPVALVMTLRKVRPYPD